MEPGAVKSQRTVTLEKDLSPSLLMQVLVPVGSVVLALAVCAVFLPLSGVDPLEAYSEMLSGVVTSYGITETILRAIPLTLAGLGLGIAFRMQLWNIGGEGQLYMGACAATGIALYMPDKPAYIVLPLMVLAGCIAGGLWAMLPAIPRAYLGVNETITTLMFNYVAISWVDYLVYGPWKDPAGYNFPLTATFSESAALPVIIGTRIHLGLVFGIVLAIILYVTIFRTKWGYEIRVIGESEQSARYAGMNIKRQILWAMFLSGALCGLAGMSEVSGVVHRLRPGFSPGYGFTAIIVAWLSRLNPLATVVVAVLFGALQTGGLIVQTAGIDANMVSMIQGALLFFILGGELLVKYRIRFVQSAEVGED